MDKYIIAVYGTLKRGRPNYPRFLARDDVAFIGTGKTSNAYPLYVSGLPFLIDSPGLGYNVVVEVFAVTERVFAELDRLEGHPNFYRRQEIGVNLDSGGTAKAWCWFISPGYFEHSSAAQSATKPSRWVSEY